MIVIGPILIGLVVGGFPALYWLLARDRGVAWPRRLVHALVVLIVSPLILMLLWLLLYVGFGAAAGALKGIAKGAEAWEADVADWLDLFRR